MNCKAQLIFPVLLYTLITASEGLNSDSLAELSFGDLMDVEVSVTTKKERSILDAPGMVTSFNKSDIQKLGYYTLGELADITPGYSRSYLYGEQGFETRGLKVSSFNNNRHLVLVDGIPVNHVRANKAPAGRELSLFSAQQVEFLRGPASSLYGTGAYYGVINITPYSPEIKGTYFDSRIGFGGPIPERIADMHIAHRSRNTQLFASASYYQNESGKYTTGSGTEHIYWDDTKALSLQGAYRLVDGPLRGLGAGVFYFDRTSGLGEHWNGDFSHQLNNLRWETYITYLRMKRDITDMLRVDSYFKYNRSTETGDFTPLSDSAYHNYNGTGELFYEYSVPINDFQYYLDLGYEGTYVSITGGLDFDWRYQLSGNEGSYSYYITADSAEHPYVEEEILSIRSDDFITTSLFGQIEGEIPLLEGLLITGGVRYDMGKGGTNTYSQLSPRLGIVQKFTPFLNLKVLYGTALLAPGIKEISLNDEVKNRAPELKEKITDLSAETFQTLESGLLFFNTFKTTQNLVNVKVELTGFVNRTLNEIKDIKLTSGSNKIENAFVNSNDTLQTYGIECEIKSEVDFGLGFFGNYSYAKAQNKAGNSPVDIPLHKVNGGITYSSRKSGMYGSLIGRYVHEFSTSEGAYLNGYTVADVTLGWNSPFHVGAEIHMTNILNEQVIYPQESTPLIPLRERQVSLSLTASF